MSSPVVGTAWVRVKLLSQNLGKDIANEVHRQIKSNGDAFDLAGQTAGKRVAQGMVRGVNNERPKIREAGARAGEQFGMSFGGRFNRAVTRLFGPSFSRALNNRLGTVFNGSGARIARSFRGNDFLNKGRDLAQELHRGFNLGIGAARMGPAIVAALNLAGPSILSGAAALGTGLGGALFAGLAAAGPGVAGFGAILAAGLSTAVLNLGLLSIGLKSVLPDMEKLKEEASALKNEVADPIATGFLDSFRNSIATLRTRLLPAINDLLTETGRKFGDIATNIAETVTRADNLSRIRGILATNIEFLSRFNTGVGGLTTSFLILWNAAKPFVDLIGDSIGRFGTWLQTTLETKEANGELAGFFENLVVQARRIGAILVDLGNGLKGIFEAALPSGDRLLTQFGDLAQKFNDWANSGVGQEKLTAFFANAEALGGRVLSMFGKLAVGLFNAFANMDTGPLLAILDIIENKVAPALGELFSQIKEGAGDNLVTIFDNIGTALQNLADSGALQKAAEAISTILVKVSEFAASDLGGKIIAIGAPLLLFSGFISSVAGPLGTVISLLGSPVLLRAAGIFGLIVTAVMLLWNNSEKLRTAIGALVEGVLPILQQIWTTMEPIVSRLWEAVQKLAGAIGDALAPVIEKLTPVFQAFLAVAGVALQIIGNALVAFVEILTWVFEQIGGVINGIIFFFENFGTVMAGIWAGIVGVFHATFDPVIAWWQGLWNNIVAIASTIWNIIWTTATSIWNSIVQTIMAVVTPIVAFFVGLWNGVVAILTGVWNFISGLASTVWNWIITTIMNIVTPIATFLSGIWQGISDTASTIWNGITGIASGAWNAVVSAIHTVVDPVVGWLQERWDDIKGAVETVFNAIAGPVRAAWDAVYAAIVEPIQNALSVVTGVVNSIVSVVSGALSSVTSFFDQISEKAAAAAQLGSVTVATPFSALGGPAVAEGGYANPVPGGFPVLIAEGGKRERIEPLDPNGLSRRDAAMIEHIMSSTLSAIGGSGSGTTLVNVRIGDRELRDIVQTEVKDGQNQLARQLRNGRRPR